MVEVMEATDLDTIFILSLSQQAMEELDHLQIELQNVPYDENAKDQWQRLWGNDYTSKKFYNHTFSNIQTPPSRSGSHSVLQGSNSSLG